MNFNSWLGTDSRRANVRQNAVKVKQLPATEDVCKFTVYLRSVADDCYKYLLDHSEDDKFPYDKWLLLGKTVQCQWVLFNRPRSGEMSRVLLSQYETHSEIDPAYIQGLDDEQRKLCRHFRRFMMVTKKLRILHILTTDKQIMHLDLFISLRGRAGISGNNRYLFAAQTKNGWIHCGQVLKCLAKRSGVSKPYLMGTTNIRKQVTTLAQHLKMDYNEMLQLADFMGHDLKVHQQNYRQHEAVMQATKIAKFFMAAQTENMTEYRSKNIDEIDIYLDSEPIVLDDGMMDQDEEEHNDTDNINIQKDTAADKSIQGNDVTNDPVFESSTHLPSQTDFTEPSTSQNLNELLAIPYKKNMKKASQKRRFPTTPELLSKLACEGRIPRKIKKKNTKQEE